MRNRRQKIAEGVLNASSKTKNRRRRVKWGMEDEASCKISQGITKILVVLGDFTAGNRRHDSGAALRALGGSAAY
jgi:hypothetical protein